MLINNIPLIPEISQRMLTLKLENQNERMVSDTAPQRNNH